VTTERLCLSIVSHGQLGLVLPLLESLDGELGLDFNVLLTLNIPEPEDRLRHYSFPLKVVRNVHPKGFGGNHNSAFAQSRSEFFAVVNPDIRLDRLSAEPLLRPFVDPTVGCCAPLIRSPEGTIEDSARKFPTWFRLARRAILGRAGPDYPHQFGPILVDWVGGMFAVFRRTAFADVAGFDDRRYFMYYEDVDLCYRLNAAGWSVVYNPLCEVVHDARRASHRQWRHMRWHGSSLLRFMTGL
jgi:N-acetylglucosaminyl-diphospho-decaprenol L-rhamnosyltransferase